MASGGIKNMVSFPTAPGYEDYVNYQFHDNWYGVVTSICAVSIVAVTAGAIMRHRLLVHKAEADDVVDEQVRIVKVERMPDVMA